MPFLPRASAALLSHGSTSTRRDPSRSEQNRTSRDARRTVVRLLVAFALLQTTWLVLEHPVAGAAGPCDVPANEIVAENCLPGDDPSEWDISGAGDPSIQGFATDLSVDQGQTVDFKIDTTAADYRIDIYRLGYYGGLGARQVATIDTAATTETDQPECTVIDGTTDDNLVDCGNWSVSASWAVPPNAASGIYIAKPTRADDDGASHIAFVVRDDDGASDLLVQTSDSTWQAYNRYGGYSLYDGPGHAHKVSYNRPYATRGGPVEDWLFNAEFPMLRWLERNGYDVSYATGIDSARSRSELLEHEAFLSVGHDEYWSAEQRANVEAARDAGVDLAFFSVNEVYWKTRWEASTADGGSTDHRTLVSYKEGDAQGSEHWDCLGNFACDPDPDTWTGLWRQNAGGHDGGQPENGLSGQISWGDSTAALEVPANATGFRFWRNTGMSGATSLSAGTLGYEFDWEQPAFAGSNPDGRITVSDTTAAGKNHKMSLYRAPSGALVFGAGTVQWSWGLDGTHDRGASTEDPRIQQATVNLLSDMGAQPAALQGELVPGGALDETAPAAVITDPAPAATVAGGTVTISGTASDTGGVVAAVEVSRDGGATWSRATGTTSWTYSFTASDGPMTAQARAIDDAANIGAAASVAFDVGPQVCPCSIFGSAVTGNEVNDFSAVELGVKLRSDASGSITGIRFYKTPGNTGTHTGTLWSSAGENLATVTFTGESASGWQEATFDTPVSIDADTTYIASYHTTVGGYAIGTSFATAGVDSPPLHALQGGVDGPNGVYRYGGGGVFPVDSFGSSNYLVDVVFMDEVGPDETAPTIVQRSPAPGATGVAVNANVTAELSEPMAASSIDGTSVELRDPSDAVVAATVSYLSGTRTAVLDPDAALAYSTSYTATVRGGVGGVTDAAGNPLAADVTWTFTTAAPPPPPPDEGPGGPILVVSSTANPFSRYYVEILRNEGLNAFNAADLSTVDAPMLADYDVVVLGDIDVTPTQAAMFDTWVSGGGNLIAMRPDADLADLVGLTDQGTQLSNGYLAIDTSTGTPGEGLVSDTIQFHGTADRYGLAPGTQALATLYSDAATATSNPAVTVRAVGNADGQAAAFTYDLARSVVSTRQGNPAWAGQERDGEQPPIKRADDLFYPDWVDLSKAQIPQADEQQRLLANLIQEMNRDRMPLPRFWYFPRGERAVVVLTGDDHASNGTPGQFDWDASVSPPGCNVDAWECVRGTSYLYPSTPIGDAAAAAYEAQGFELSLHVNTGCTDWTPSQLTGFYDDQLADFASAYPSLEAPSTNRTHCITWSDWASQPEVQVSHGIRLDTNYYYWPAAWVQNRPGYFTGSGMPMRFAELDGSLIDSYQAATQITDESGMDVALHINTLLDNAVGPEGYFGAITANMHTDSGTHAGQQAIVNAALARGVPVVSARQMLTWLDGRNGSSFEDLAWDGDDLTFAIDAGAGANGLQAMLPTRGPDGTLATIALDGDPVTFDTETIKGVEYALFTAEPGSYAATYEVDTTPPVISSLVAVSDAVDAATISWTTDEPATSRVDYGTSASSLGSSVTDDALSTTHQIHLSGLAADTTYHFRASSADAVELVSEQPAAPASPANFKTPSGVASDTTTANFGAGTTGASTYVSNTAGGEVTLAPAIGAELDGTTIPPAWTAGSWTGGTTTVAGGHATVDGSWLRADALAGAGRAVEFAGTFSGAPFQNAGFGVTFDGPGESWAMFGVNGTAGTLQARTLDAGGSIVDVALGAQYIGSQHRFRVEWDTTVRFYIDGTLVHTAATVSGTMRPIASDYNTGGGALSIEWMRTTPYAASGSFVSRVHDAGGPAAWGSLSYVADTPAGTSLGVLVRTGSTPVPDGTWSAFTPVAHGGDIPTSGRYAQYRVDATTSSTGVTPALSSVRLPYNIVPVAPGAPTIGAAVAGNGSATVSWTAPASNGGSAITGYVVTPYVGFTPQPSTTYPSTATTQIVPGLTNGTQYRFRVQAINAVGTGTFSTTTNAVVPAAPPGAPTIGSAVAGNGQATVSWTAPASNGGSAITGYVVTPYVGLSPRPSVTFMSTATTQIVPGLTNGTQYRFRVQAINAVGTSAYSTVTNPVVPAP